jgi:arabinose-5-phosphate isomerase
MRRAKGIITDGDLRRAILNGINFSCAKAEDIMTKNPKSISKDETSANALRLMELHEIMHLVVVDDSNVVVGLLHLHDLLGREEFKLNGT